MGNSPAGRLSATYWGGNPIALGAVGGGESLTLAAAQIPTITSNVPSQAITVTGSRSDMVYSAEGITSSSATGGSHGQTQNIADSGITTVSASGTVAAATATSNNTSGQAHRTIGPRKLCTFYMKL
jgi:hypothetical protein